LVNIFGPHGEERENKILSREDIPRPPNNQLANSEANEEPVGNINKNNSERMYLYYGIVYFQNQSNEIILELLFAADELVIQRLIDSVQEFTLEKTLHELIQFVRFHQINGEEFMLEVWPFRHLLPDDLIEDIFRCYLVSSAVPRYHAFTTRWCNFKVDSVLVNKKIVLLLTGWIDKISVFEEFRYKFNLLFRSSRDGLSSQTFHQKCDNKGATIVIAKISNSNMLVGGYNPLDWNGNGVWKNTTDSFIFSLSDPNNLQSAKLGRVTNSNYAVHCSNQYGPLFGNGNDLYAPSNSSNWMHVTSAYSNIEGSNPLIISDYEVFQIVKN
ncbi:9163_t:CDS:2, partial [Gigaspora rosea]